MTDITNEVRQLNLVSTATSEQSEGDTRADSPIVAEVWKTIDGYGGSYQVSNQGRVRSVDRHTPVTNPVTGSSYEVFYKGQLKSVSPDKYGLLKVKLNHLGKRQTAYVGRLVAMAFVEGQEKDYIVTYKDGDRSNCAANNLVWKSNRAAPATGDSQKGPQ